MITIIVPVLNEEGTLQELAERIDRAMSGLGDRRYEILFVDDGSSDASWTVIQSLSRAHPLVRGYRLRRNFGKATALALGAEMASGDDVGHA